MGCPQTAEGYDDFVRNTYAPMIAEMSEYFPVIVGSGACSTPSAAVWTPTADKACSTARKAQAETLTAEQKRSLYQGVAESQLAAWSKGSGYYWNYKLLTDTVNTPWLDRLGRMGPRALHRPRLVPRPKVIPSDARIV